MRFLLVDTWAEHDKTESVGSHAVRSFNPRRFLDAQHYATYLTADRIVALHRQGDSSMKAMLRAFGKAAEDFGADGFVAHQNPFPPEWLVAHTEGLVRALGCFDDPHKTYSATLPVVWAYHGAYYCSPSYSATQRFPDVLAMFGVQHTHWFPLSYVSPTDSLIKSVSASWARRYRHAVYIGKCYGDKVDKLAQFNKGICGQLHIYGQGWPLAGLAGFVAPLRGRHFFPKFVRPLDAAGRTKAYLMSLIGLNMHLGDGEETGNMRMYETPMHGSMLLCDVAGCNAHADIFEPDTEAVYYRSIDEAIDKCLYYFRHPDQAISIAQRGFDRARRDYHPRRVLGHLLDWVASLPQRGFASRSDMTAGRPGS